MSDRVNRALDAARAISEKPATISKIATDGPQVVVDRGAVLMLVSAMQEMVRAGGDRAATDLLTARLVGLIEAMGYAVPNAESTTE